jgi:hypothetical protein
MVVMKVLICGSRNWQNRETMEAWIAPLLDFYGDALVVVHGGAEGADRVADGICADLGIPTVVYVPEWNRYGKAAGPIRNEVMVTEEDPDLVLAFTADLKTSKGTESTVRLARKHKKPVRIIGG